jgi:UDP-N-acetylmuramoyl-tripeptide--D-alanyl-D-alanine ligase
MNLENIYELFLKSSGVCTDTRKIKPNSLFFALKGPNFNANSFADEALKQGACYAVIDDKSYESENCILVEDTLECLQNLARLHRQHLKFPIIGLTGSNGKTTTKELIFSVLHQKYRVNCTQGNLNNHIGVALTILDFSLDLDFGIVEMGANHQKEIEFLCSISQPDFGLITNFGKAHLEGFGGVEGVIKGKSELYDFIKENNRTAFINGNDPKQLKQIGNYPKVVTFGSEPMCDYLILMLTVDPYVSISYENIDINSQLIGDYNFGNLAVAVAIGAYFKVSPEAIQAGIESYHPNNNRSEVIKKGSNKIIMDAYNANPSSMMAALKNFNRLESPSKYLFLGDMFELGEDAAAEHQAVVDFVEANFQGPIYLIGNNFYESNTKSSTQKFKSFEAAIPALSSLHITNSQILIKGSRGMALERLLEHLAL